MSRQANERTYVDEVVSQLAKRVALVPWLVEAPMGTTGLLATLGEERSETVVARA